MTAGMRDKDKAELQAVALMVTCHHEAQETFRVLTLWQAVYLGHLIEHLKEGGCLYPDLTQEEWGLRPYSFQNPRV